MTDYGSFAQAGLFTDEQNSGERDFASTGQKLPPNSLMKRLPATSFGQNISLCTSQITTQLQLPNEDICAPNLDDVRRAAKRFLETTIGDSYTPQGQVVSKWGMYNGEDADFARVLDNLPTSYDDFESKELHLKLERNLSSPLMTCQSPSADSGRVSAGSSLTKSSNMHLCDAGSNPPDADDLEVAMINQSFEEQQKQTKLYASPGLKDLFYSQPNTTDDRAAVKNFEKEATSNANQSLLVASNTQKSDSDEEPLFATDLLLSNVETKSVVPKESLTVGSPWTIRKAESAKTKLEAKSVTIISSNVQDIASNPLSPITKGDTGFGSDDCESIREFGYNGGSFDVEEMILDDSSLRRASQEAFGNSLATLKAVSDLIESQHEHMRGPLGTSSASATDDGMEATEALAVDVVESLFDGSGLADVSSASDDAKNPDSVIHEDKNDAPVSYTHESCSLVELVDGKKEQESTGKEKRKDEAVVPSCGTVDSWEELDNDDYSSKLVNEIESAMCKVRIRKPKIDYLGGRVTDPWDDNTLPHVLEAYNLPPKFTEADVKQELAKHDSADVAIHPVDETHCLVVFASKNAALQAMIAVRQRQSIATVRLRSLHDATRATQQKARKYEAMLGPHKQRPQTTPLVARRLVEGALGKRSNVSAQQISNERKLLKDAKELKHAKAAVWEDGP